MISRRIIQKIELALSRQAAVCLVGPRQVGKTTLALEIADKRPAIYLDLENLNDRTKLSDPVLFLKDHEEKLVILDEVHRLPGIFQPLRGLIDEGRRNGKKTGRFLLLGSASIDLLRQSGESLAGRIEYIELQPLDVLEIEAGRKEQDKLFLRGGFPDSFLASNDADSLQWRHSFIRTYLERDIPLFGPRVPAETLERLWTMLAHSQGTLLRSSRLATSLMVTAPTISRYIDLFVDLLLLRRLRPYQGNIKKRLVKSPKLYVRDSGLVHALLGIQDATSLAGHPIVGMSWEGFVIESLVAAAPEFVQASFYRTAAGAEIDLILEMGGNTGLWAIEIKRGLSPKIGKGFHHAMQDLKPARSFIVYSGTERYPVNANVEAIDIPGMARMLAAL